jgi:hypothetical protein
MQLAAARESDEPLLALAAKIGARRNAASKSLNDFRSGAWI